MNEIEGYAAKEMVVRVEVDPISVEIAKAFDVHWDGEQRFRLPRFAPPKDFSLGVIVGPSGSGKSSLLRDFFTPSPAPEWDPNRSVAAHFASADEATAILGGVGFNTIPSWLRPYHVLSTGEKARADVARQLQDEAVVDEFTSTVDRDTARSMARSLSRLVRERGYRRIVLATPHADIVPWLEPDWCFDTGIGDYWPRGALQRPQLHGEVRRCPHELWASFAPHHYLSHQLNKASTAYALFVEGKPVGFCAILAFPHPIILNAYRGHRTVILPAWQGLGLGIRLSEAVASILRAEGKRFFSRTAHPRLGNYRTSRPDKWRPTSQNLNRRDDFYAAYSSGNPQYMKFDFDRVCWAHEFIGSPLAEVAKVNPPDADGPDVFDIFGS